MAFMARTYINVRSVAWKRSSVNATSGPLPFSGPAEGCLT